MPQNNDLSIVIPCFNEPDNIPPLIDKLTELIHHNKVIKEIILVDGCSTDNTPSILKTCLVKANEPKLKAIYRDQRKGYGYDICVGLNQASGKYLAWTHADLQTDPKDVVKAYYQAYSDNESTLVKGRRQNRRYIEAFFTWGMQVLAALALGFYMDDINAQPKVFTQVFYNQHIKDKAPHDFSLDLFLLYQAKKNGYLIKTIPVDFSIRQYGEAKGGGSLKGRIQLIIRTFKYIFKLRRKVAI